MAIGDYGNNNNRNSGKAYEPTYYSRVRINGLNNKRLGISYRSGLMCLEIGNVSEGFKVEPSISIFLSPMKATMFASQINAFLAYRNGKELDPNKGFGINAGMNEKITFAAFSTDDKKNIYLTIGKFNGSGIITESDKIQFSVDYNYSLEWDNLGSNELTKVYNNDLDIITLRNAIEDFGRSMTGATGYAALDLNRFNAAHVDKRIDEIFDKLGIERRTYEGGNRNYQQNNFLSNSSSKTTTFEDVEDLLD